MMIMMTNVVTVKMIAERRVDLTESHAYPPKFTHEIRPCDALCFWFSNPSSPTTGFHEDCGLIWQNYNDANGRRQVIMELFNHPKLIFISCCLMIIVQPDSPKFSIFQPVFAGTFRTFQCFLSNKSNRWLMILGQRVGGKQQLFGDLSTNSDAPTKYSLWLSPFPFCIFFGYPMTQGKYGK